MLDGVDDGTNESRLDCELYLSSQSIVIHLSL
jgi:hypothetical protein